MSDRAERCVHCRQPVRPGATFCGACGAPLANRGGRSSLAGRSHRAGGGGSRGPAGGAETQGAPHAGTIPGSIPVGPGEGTAMGGTLALVPAAPGKRLGAAVLDWLAPAVILVVLLSVGCASITSTRSSGFIVYDTGMLVLLGSVAVGLTLIYAFVIAGIEGRSGSTIGNRLMGIRSADNDGYAPGAGAVFVRGVVTGAGMLLAVFAAALVAIFKWFAAAPWILAPLVLLGIAWAFVVVLSSAWDRNGGLRGWNDFAAKTLVFDVGAGRNPVTTGGIQGPYSFAPLGLPPVQQVASPVASPVLSQPVPPSAAANNAGNHPDDSLDRTQLRGDSGLAAPVAVLRIQFDDGRDFRLDRNVLVGRNPAANAGESQAQLLAVPDPGRTISKTHLHLLTDGAGVWVTDRHSTNGSAVTTPDGVRTALQPGVPSFVSPGATVHFGDRSFTVGQA